MPQLPDNVMITIFEFKRPRSLLRYQLIERRFYRSIVPKIFKRLRYQAAIAGLPRITKFASDPGNQGQALAIAMEWKNLYKYPASFK